MRFFKYLLLICFVLTPLQGFSSSCEKNRSCRERFKAQKDPLDFERESSRAHTAVFFMANFAVNRFLDSEIFINKFGRKLSKNERILYTALGLTAVGIVKEFVYDPDGLSRSDTATNLLGVGLGVTLEFSLF